LLPDKLHAERTSAILVKTGTSCCFVQHYLKAKLLPPRSFRHLDLGATNITGGLIKVFGRSNICIVTERVQASKPEAYALAEEWIINQTKTLADDSATEESQTKQPATRRDREGAIEILSFDK
jgi:hypothetical protein